MLVSTCGSFVCVQTIMLSALLACSKAHGELELNVLTVMSSTGDDTVMLVSVEISRIPVLLEANRSFKSRNVFSLTQSVFLEIDVTCKGLRIVYNGHAWG